jgi:hypothetical protein
MRGLILRVSRITRLGAVDLLAEGFIFMRRDTAFYDKGLGNQSEERA